MKQIEKLQAKARHRFGFCGSLILHFILFVALAFSGVFAMQPPVADADTVVFLDAGGGGGGGGGHGTGHGTGTGSGIGAGSGSGSGGGHGAGHGSGIGDGVGPGIARNPKVPPRVSSTAAPVYPQALRDAGIGGRVVVRGVIGTDGRVESAEVVRSSGNSTLDNNALSAFYKWRFSAAKNDAGQKVRCYFVQGFPFVIEYK